MSTHDRGIDRDVTVDLSGDIRRGPDGRSRGDLTTKFHLSAVGCGWLLP
ncbi:hypothetical protein [Streptomyces sp. SLBN-118]|nr:hypothetical protein [Streptomyces sp. SLBN-118]